MKTILLIISLTCFNAMAKSQLYYGANVGIGLGKYYNGKTKDTAYGLNQFYLRTPVGYASRFLVVEGSFQTSFPLVPSLELSIGGKTNFNEHWGIHVMGGYRDEMAINLEPLQITHYFFPQTTLRLWIGNFDIESKYVFRKEIFGGNSFEFGIGVIGF